MGQQEAVWAIPIAPTLHGDTRVTMRASFSLCSTLLRSTSRLSRLRRLVPGALLLAMATGALVPALAQTTTFTGKVYSPNGPTGGDPIPNILVFAVNPAYPPPVFTRGIVQGGSCQQQPSLVPAVVLGSAISDASGTYTFSTTQAIPNPVTIVIQAGKWRRQYQFDQTVVTPGAVNTLPALSMPGSQSQGDLPHIAVITGSADGIECIFRQIGIQDSEFTAPSGTGSINLYPGDGSSGGAAVAGTTPPTEVSLVGSPSTLSSYDLVMFGCEGNANDPDAKADGSNLVSYANSGGRVFATHFGYAWLEGNGDFDSAAVWTGTANSLSDATGLATINTSYPEGAILANWMKDIGALTSNPPPEVTLTNVRVNTSAVNNPPAQSWVSLNSDPTGAANPSMQFTFDTPIGAATTPTVAINFTNQSSAYLRGDTADHVTVNVVNNSGQAADASLALTIALPSGLSATAATDATGAWVCNIASATNVLCSRTAALLSGATDSVALTFSIASSTPAGTATISASLAGGGLSDSTQCGRVLYNDYHVEQPSGTITKNEAYPNECVASTTLNAVEKFLEFSLYNLSNFVFPTATDPLLIQAVPTLTWNPPAAIYYGTPLGLTQLDATASVAGTFAYTPPAGTILPLGPNTLSVVFTPNDTTDYLPANASVQIQVLQDTTGVVLTSTPNPSDYLQNVTFTAVVTGNASAPQGTVSFLDSGALIGSGNLGSPLGDSSTATFNIATLLPGTHSITASYGMNTTVVSNWGPSTSNPLLQVVLAPSSTVISGLVSPIFYGQIIADTAVVTVTGASTGGTVTVYIDNVAVCTLPVSAGTISACPPTTGAGYSAGNHTLYAMFSGDAQYASSTSPTYTVQILPDTTQIVLASSVNPSNLGQSVTFTASMNAPYATPVGPVAFLDGGTQIGSANLAPTGVTNTAAAAFSTSALAVGTHNITASYAAKLNFDAAASTPALPQVVQIPPPNNGLPGFLMTVSPTTLSVGVGNSLGITITVIEYNGFSQPTQLACSGLPVEATCTFASTSIPGTGGSTILTISPAAPHACSANAPPYFTAPNAGGAGLGLLSLALVLARKRRKLLRGIALCAVLFVLPAIQGCGSCFDYGTKPGTYTFTVTGTAAGAQPSASQSQTVTMNATI